MWAATRWCLGPPPGPRVRSAAPERRDCELSAGILRREWPHRSRVEERAADPTAVTTGPARSCRMRPFDVGLSS